MVGLDGGLEAVRKEKTGKGDIRRQSWGRGWGGQGRLSHSLPLALYPASPQSGPRVGAVYLCSTPGSGGIVYLGEERRGASAQPEVQKGLQQTDSMTSSRTAAWHLGSCKHFKQRGHESEQRKPVI